MKYVPCRIEEAPDFFSVQPPPNICIGCMAETKETLRLAFRTMFYQNEINFPCCKDCQQVEALRKDSLQRLSGSASTRSFILFAAVSLAGIGTAFTLGMFTPMRWWAAIVAIAALFLASKVATSVRRVSYSRDYERFAIQWAKDHPRVPDPAFGPVYIPARCTQFGPINWRSEKITLSRFQKFWEKVLCTLRLRKPTPDHRRWVARISVDNLCCQNDGYANVLLAQPLHSLLAKAINGEVPLAQVIDALPKNQKSRWRSPKVREDIEVWNRLIDGSRRQYEEWKRKDGFIYIRHYLNEMVDHYLHLAELQENSGQYTAALKSVKAALAADHDNLIWVETRARAHFNHGRLLQRLGRTEEAKGELAEAVKLEPELAAVEP